MSQLSSSHSFVPFFSILMVHSFDNGGYRTDSATTLCGAPEYLAPEQVECRVCSAPIFGLNVHVMICLTTTRALQDSVILPPL